MRDSFLRGNGDTGNTTDSKPVVGGSNPSSPAEVAAKRNLEIRKKNEESRPVPSRRREMRKNRKRRSALGDGKVGRCAKM